MSIKTPLGRVLGLGSAKEGTDHWWAQRLTAVANVMLGLWFMIALANLNSYSYTSMLRWIAEPWTGVFLALLSGSIAYHSALGVQVVIEDYVHAPALKVMSLVASRFAHFLLGVACIYAVIRIGLDL